MRVSATRRSVWSWGDLSKKRTTGAAIRLTAPFLQLQAVVEGIAERRGIDSEEIADVAKRERPGSTVVEEPVPGFHELPPPRAGRVAARERAKGVLENCCEQRELGQEAGSVCVRVLARQQRRRLRHGRHRPRSRKGVSCSRLGF